MDYKYIEQLLEQYWQGETSLEEELALRSFFCTEEVPAHLLRYRDLFVYQQVQQEIGLGNEFDERLLAQIEVPVVKANRITMLHRLMPLFKAVAVVAILVSLGNAVQHAFFVNDAMDASTNGYTQTDQAAGVAYKKNPSTVEVLSDGVDKVKDKQLLDSLSELQRIEVINE